MPKATRQEMTLTHLADQTSAVLRTHQSDIERIANDGPGPDDDDMVRMVFCIVAGNLLSGRPGTDG